MKQVTLVFIASFMKITCASDLCSWEVKENYMLKGAKKIGKPIKKTVDDCKELCVAKKGCVGFNWKKEKCTLVKSYKKISKKKKNTVGFLDCSSGDQTCSCGLAFGRENNRIAGGQEARSYPWNIYLRNRCSGSLISNQHVLTAA